MTRVAIIGGGITGLSTAYYLKQLDSNVEVDLYEASDRFGGKVKTYRDEDYTLELGPESYLGRKVIMTELAKSLGLEDELVRNQVGQSYIYANNRLHPMPGGSILGIPTEIVPFMKTGLLSPQAKVRAGMELFVPKTTDRVDISLGQFFRQRLGNGVLENIIEPLLSGIYGGNIDRLSLESTFPMFRDQVIQQGSLIKGMAETKKARRGQSSTDGGQFLQFKSGLESMIDALVEAVEEMGVNTHLNSKVDYNYDGQHQVIVNDDVVAYDNVVITTPHQVFKRWFSDDAMFTWFNQMPSTSVATVLLVFDESQVHNEHEGTGFVVARNSDVHITACTWTNKKWPHTTPEGKVVLRAYIGKPDDPIVEHATDDELVNIALSDLNEVMTIDGRPERSFVTKLVRSMPQYEVGHKRYMDILKSHINQQYPGLIITGASIDAVGLPDCVGFGKASAEQILT